MTATALPRAEGHAHTIDMASFCNDKMRFFALSVKAPPFAKEVNPEALGLQVGDRAIVAKAVRETCRAITLPASLCKSFSALRSAAAGALGGFSVPFPFVPEGAVAVPLHRIEELWAEMDTHFSKFSDAKGALIASLPALQEEQRAAWKLAARSAYDGWGSEVTDSYEEFEGSWLAAFDRAFPSANKIEKEYTFDFRAMGSFKRSISLTTRDEVLKDEATQAKLRVLQASEKKLQDEFFEWVGGVAAQTRTKLLEALYPTMEKLKGGHSVGKRDLDAITKQIEGAKNLNIFGDAKLDDIIAQVTAAVGSMREAQAGKEKAAQATAAEALKAAGAVVEGSLKGLAFNPLDYRRLEIDGDGGENDVFADKDVCARITEEMQAALKESIAKLSGSAETEAARADAEKRLNLALGIAESVKAGDISPEMAEVALGAAIQASTIDVGDGLDDGPAPAVEAEAPAGALEIGDGPIEIQAPEPVAVEGLEL